MGAAVSFFAKQLMLLAVGKKCSGAETHLSSSAYAARRGGFLTASEAEEEGEREHIQMRMAIKC